MIIPNLYSIISFIYFDILPQLSSAVKRANEQITESQSKQVALFYLLSVD